MIFEAFVWRALLGGVGLAMVAGPLGCFVVWRRMAYFGDALAHGALLGLVLGLALRWELQAGVIVVFAGMAALLAWLESRRHLATDTLLGLLSHAALASGLVGISLMRGATVDLMGVLFGDILSVTAGDLGWIYAGGTVVLVVLVALWRPLLAVTVHEELALAEGVPVGWMRLITMLLVALVIVMAMKIVGVLLITALLIIPPATARYLARSPEAMAVLASLCGVVAVVAGLLASLIWDTPSGPSVVVAASLLFLGALVSREVFHRMGIVR
ncbi:MAG TPA: iron chelate uptake ABC transporter family permease subunit [Burkholderiaceae bacterium]|nr:iron chelate uptake ABC transporter family permease subunit [Burkholderiaceae bacterium]